MQRSKRTPQGVKDMPHKEGRNTRNKRRLYFDAAATTPVDPRVAVAMRPFLSDHYANAGSIHIEGIASRRALTDVRKRIAAVLRALPDEIVFTSGGTESNNLAIFGVAGAVARAGGGYGAIQVVTSAIEHPSVLEVCKEIERRGGRVSYVPVDERGVLKIAALKRAVTPETTLVSVMMANNEIGTLQPLRDIVRIIRATRKRAGKRTPYFHVDGAQAAVYEPLHVQALGVDLLSIDGHKMYGPKGVGLLYVKRGTPLAPLFFGGGQEMGLRSGTTPLPLIVGLAKAFEIADKERENITKRMRVLRAYFIECLQRSVQSAVLNGDTSMSLPNVVNISVPGADSDSLVIGLDARGIACAARSACHAGDEVSHVVAALGKGEDIASGTVRFSMLKSVSKRDIERAVVLFGEVVADMRRSEKIARGSEW